MASKKLIDTSKFPRPPLCERTGRQLQVKWNGTTIASTNEAYWVLETHHPPTYYLPPSSIKVELDRTGHSSLCEWKGRATYWSIKDPQSNKIVSNSIWSYESPTQGFREIKDYLSFYADPWECFVDGEKVEPQPGDFYGGWMTSDIDVEKSKVKGGKGTLWW